MPAGGHAHLQSKNKFETCIFTGKLEVQSMNLRSISREVEKIDISDLMIIDLSKNKFNEIPREILQAIDMEDLNCYYNMIRVIPDLTPLRFLRKLNLSRNQLTSLPSSLCTLPIEQLFLANNKIHTLPEEIGTMTQLSDLDLSCNMLSSIPPTFGKLSALRDLNARNNFITHVPSELTETPLVRLDLSYNRIAIIPPSYRFLKDLKFLDITNNPLVCPPAQYAERGRVHIFKLLEILVWQQEQKDLLEYEKVFRRKKEEERLKHNFGNPRNTAQNSKSFINDLLVSWDAQATAWMLEDPFFKKELEKDKTYREKYGIGGDYMKRSLQVAQGRSINTINRSTGKVLAKQLASSEAEGSKLSRENSKIREVAEPAPSPQSEKKDKKKKETKTKSPKVSKHSPKADKSPETPKKSPKEKISGNGGRMTEKEEAAALASLDEVLLGGLSETDSRSSTLNSNTSKRTVSFSTNEEVIPPAPACSPPQSDEEEEEEGETRETSFTMGRTESKAIELQMQKDFIKNVVARYLAVSLQDVDSLKDGVLLCQLLNVMRKNTIRMVHVPQGSEGLSTLKASRNLGGFLSFAQLQFGRECIALPDLQTASVPAIYRTLKRLTDKFPCQSDA